MLKKDIKPNEHSFVDTDIIYNKIYQYTLVAAIDDAGLASEPSFPLTVKTYLNGTTEELVVKNIDKKKERIQWNEPKVKPGYYIIYIDEGKGMMQYANAGPDDTRYLDKGKVLKR